MTGAQIAGSPILYVLIAIGLLSVIVFALYSFSKAKKRCLELGMSSETISNVVKTTITSSLVPSLAILLGFLILAVSLGPAVPFYPSLTLLTRTGDWLPRETTLPFTNLSSRRAGLEPAEEGRN